MSVNLIILYTNFASFALTAFFLYLKYRTLDLRILMYIWTAFMCFMGAYTYAVGIYQRTWGHATDVLSPIPYVLNYFFVYILLYPLRNIVLNLKNIRIEDSSSVNTFITFSTIIFAGYVVFTIVDFIYCYTFDFAELYANQHDEGGINGFWANTPGFRTLYYIVSEYYKTVFPAYIIYHISKYLQSGGTVKLILHLIIALLPFLLSKLQNGSRGGIFFFVFDLLFFYYIYRDKIPFQLKKYIKYFAVLVFWGGYLLSLSITESRFDKSYTESNEMTENAIIRYFGEAAPNLCFEVWDKDPEPLMGQRFYKNIFDFFSLSPQKMNGTEEWYYFETQTKCPIWAWKTMFGEVYIEFGIIGAFLFILLLSYFFIKKIKYNNIGYCSLLFFYWEICVGSPINYVKASSLYLYTILYIFFFIFIYNRFILSKEEKNG